MTATTHLTRTDAPRSIMKFRRASDGGRTRLIVCLVIVAVYVIAAIVGPMIMQYDPVRTDLANRLLSPWSHRADGSLVPLGTDQVGHDLLGQLFMGARVSMVAGLATLVLAGLIGVTLGLLAGFFGGWVDSVVMRIADVQLAFPALLLAILLAAVLGPSIVNVIVVLSVANWVTFARVTRGQVLSLKNREFVQATRTIGARTPYLMVRTILPSCLAPLLVVGTVGVGQVIIAEASLSFLGLGTPASLPSWGLVIADGRDYLINAWWISTLPGVALAGLVLTLGIIGDTLRDRFDPKMRTL